MDTPDDAGAGVPLDEQEILRRLDDLQHAADYLTTKRSIRYLCLFAGVGFGPLRLGLDFYQEDGTTGLLGTVCLVWAAWLILESVLALIWPRARSFFSIGLAITLGGVGWLGLVIYSIASGYDWMPLLLPAVMALFLPVIGLALVFGWKRFAKSLREKPSKALVEEVRRITRATKRLHLKRDARTIAFSAGNEWFKAYLGAEIMVAVGECGTAIHFLSKEAFKYYVLGTEWFFGKKIRLEFRLRETVLKVRMGTRPYSRLRLWKDPENPECDVDALVKQEVPNLRDGSNHNA